MGRQSNLKLAKRAAWSLDRLHSLKRWKALKPRIMTLRSLMGIQ